ncbi:hypothetical protein BEH94_07890 [Candidatus Altiarchaeales archaeon WOR_SM1_SCG]|nr:hypothetical protein BEH94_07890 [Candidatus Altiarchaeales archaeon WOR_SM1_SCG]
MGIFDFLSGPPNMATLKSNKDVEGLIKALKYKRDSNYYKDEMIRSEAAMALGEIGDTRAVDPLIHALSDKSSDVRLVSVSALGMIGDTRAIEIFIPVLMDRDCDLKLRLRLVWALGMIGEPAVDALIHALENTSDLDVREGITMVLGAIGDVKAVEPIIHSMEDGWSREKAADALVLIGKPAVKPLTHALRDDGALKNASRRTRESAKNALKKIRANKRRK